MSSEAAAPPAWLDSSAAQLRRLWSAAAAVRPLYVVGGLVIVQWIALLGLALTVRHNGWLYYAGGDQLWHYTGAYTLAHGHLPPAYVGYGWSVLLLPFAAIAGPNLVAALPLIVLFNTLVLLPVALLCVYGIASRIAGRIFGYWAAALWIAIPYLGIVFVNPGYHQKYTELTLPQLLGLSSVPDFPATVALLVSAYFCLRAADAMGRWPAVTAGLAAGYSIAIKPSNAIFLVAPALFFAAVRWRELLPFAAGLAPALLTLALWKYRGLGELAAAPAEQIRIAGGAGGLLDRIHTPKLNSWDHLHQVLLALREHFWIPRVMEWLPLAGLVALLLRAWRALLLIGGWFVIYLLLKATYIPASVDDASFWRIMMPAYPAFVLLAACVVLLVPGTRTRPAPAPVTLAGRRLTIAVAAAFGVFAVVPLGVIAATPRLHDQGSEAVRLEDTLIPVPGDLDLRAEVTDGTAHLRWDDSVPRAARGFYRVLRDPAWRPSLGCAGRLNDAADNCVLTIGSVAATRAGSFDDRPGRGEWTYRIGVAANWLDDPALGDVYVVSRPVTVNVR